MKSPFESLLKQSQHFVLDLDLHRSFVPGSFYEHDLHSAFHRVCREPQSCQSTFHLGEGWKKTGKGGACVADVSLPCHCIGRTGGAQQHSSQTTGAALDQHLSVCLPQHRGGQPDHCSPQAQAYPSPTPAGGLWSHLSTLELSVLPSCLALKRLGSSQETACCCIKETCEGSLPRPDLFFIEAFFAPPLRKFFPLA